jgi:hypothetical protein
LKGCVYQFVVKQHQSLNCGIKVRRNPGFQSALREGLWTRLLCAKGQIGRRAQSLQRDQESGAFYVVEADYAMCVDCNKALSISTMLGCFSCCICRCHRCRLTRCRYHLRQRARKGHMFVLLGYPGESSCSFLSTQASTETKEGIYIFTVRTGSVAVVV